MLYILIGFIHEHQRPDRDKYINVLWENVQEGHEEKLQKDDKFNMDEQKDFPYDFCSVTHYSRFTGTVVSTSLFPMLIIQVKLYDFPFWLNYTSQIKFWHPKVPSFMF